MGKGQSPLEASWFVQVAGGTSGFDPVPLGITGDKHSTKATWLRHGLGYFTEARLYICLFMTMSPGLPPALWTKLEPEGTKPVPKGSSYCFCLLKSGNKHICVFVSRPGCFSTFWSRSVYTCT